MSECPHPKKHRYFSEEEINAEIQRRREKRGAVLRSYRCRCGALHLTSKHDSARTVAEYLDSIATNTKGNA